MMYVCKERVRKDYLISDMWQYHTYLMLVIYGNRCLTVFGLRLSHDDRNAFDEKLVPQRKYSSRGRDEGN